MNYICMFCGRDNFSSFTGALEKHFGKQITVPGHDMPHNVIYSKLKALYINFLFILSLLVQKQVRKDIYSETFWKTKIG